MSCAVMTLTPKGRPRGSSLKREPVTTTWSREAAAWAATIGEAAQPATHRDTAARRRGGNAASVREGNFIGSQGTWCAPPASPQVDAKRPLHNGSGLLSAGIRADGRTPVTFPVRDATQWFVHSGRERELPSAYRCGGSAG
ncbi:hypothetical protein CATMQ487_18730 [Sphaerotilus microaerophilus]|uniref:Uncharacterized protein n=1 Tax=Sphaerotilus microaerophilus TaxID=2914710 RepID=A0ABM7YKL0_9BURK|nr:hypothetical protein CATMQ487_18730 [Sphaerotilus sp. FB-5]